MPSLSLEQAYPSLSFRPRTRNWWARLTCVPAECVHLEVDHSWAATFLPDTLFLRGAPRLIKDPPRPEVSLCRDCLFDVLEDELVAFDGRVVAFEPNPEHLTQYFYVDRSDFEAAGLLPETTAAIEKRLAEKDAECETCGAPAKWLWLSREDVPSLDDNWRIMAQPGVHLCAAHGAETLCRALGAFADVNLLYVNAPYGEAGAYVWI